MRNHFLRSFPFAIIFIRIIRLLRFFFIIKVNYFPDWLVFSHPLFINRVILWDPALPITAFFANNILIFPVFFLSRTEIRESIFKLFFFIIVWLYLYDFNWLFFHFFILSSIKSCCCCSKSNSIRTLSPIFSIWRVHLFFSFFKS